jgi:AhpD family alkylhydroperoxidase
MQYKRISLQNISRPMFEGMVNIETYLKHCGLDQRLLELVKYRVSQINGCGFCVEMHHREAIRLRESEQRLHGLFAWRESKLFAAHERAALAYAEVLTLTHKHTVEDSLFETMTSCFSLSEIADITLAITQTNSWNRINKAFGAIAAGESFNETEQTEMASKELIK